MTSVTYSMEIVVKSLEAAAITLDNDFRLTICLDNFPAVHIEPRDNGFAGCGKLMEFRVSPTAIQRLKFTIAICRYIDTLDDHLVVSTGYTAVHLKDVIVAQEQRSEFTLQSIPLNDVGECVELLIRVARAPAREIKRNSVPVVSFTRKPSYTLNRRDSAPDIPTPIQSIGITRRKSKFDLGNFRERV
jgi:hypothetical protein